LCDAVTGQAGGAARLVALERANLFLVPLDDHRQWYRYHHMFADVLRAHLLEQQPDDVGRLHRWASAWFQDHGDPADAIRHALAGGDHERAADLMELTMPAVRRDRREPELARWVRDLPDAVLRRRPVLGVAAAPAGQGRARPPRVRTAAAVRHHHPAGRPAVRTAAGRAAQRPRAGRAPAAGHRARRPRDRPRAHRQLNTLRTHTKRIYLKLGVTSRRAAVARGQALRLLPGQRKS
jgi:ATP/maltotriose-dependent transcriptional regulator MalT